MKIYSKMKKSFLNNLSPMLTKSTKFSRFSTKSSILMLILTVVLSL